MPLAALAPEPGAVPVGFLLAGAALLLSAVLPRVLSRWASTWRLLAVGMPLTIASVAVAGWWALGLSVPAALLLGAALAPTDPVLASDVRVGEPSDDPSSEDELRFALSSEAGLNDGLAMPFARAAVLLAGTAASGGDEVEVGGMVLSGVGGVACGWLVGRGLALLEFRSPTPALRFAETAQAVVGLAAVLLSYGLAELVGGYGFVAVFVTALAMRAHEPGHPYHRTLHEFVGQLERLFTMALLLALGYALPTVLAGSTNWPVVAVAVGAVLVVRPVAAGLAMVGSAVPAGDRRSIAFFGVRGIGSFYYLAFGLAGAPLGPGADTLWTVVTLTVVVSIVVHGASASAVLRRLDRQAGRPTPEPT